MKKKKPIKPYLFLFLYLLLDIYLWLIDWLIDWCFICFSMPLPLLPWLVSAENTIDRLLQGLYSYCSSFYIEYRSTRYICDKYRNWCTRWNQEDDVLPVFLWYRRCRGRSLLKALAIAIKHVQLFKRALAKVLLSTYAESCFFADDKAFVQLYCSVFLIWS